MKTLKFSHDDAELIRQKRKTAAWRIYDNEKFQVNDVVELIDKVDPNMPETWTSLGFARISSITEKRIGDVVQDDFGEDEKQYTTAELLQKYQQSYGKQVLLTTPLEIIRFKVENGPPTEDKKTMASTEMKLYADGGSRGNPGPSAAGYVLTTLSDQVVFSGGEYIGVTTNNQAEYQALKLGLEKAGELRCSTVHVYMDSMLVVNQMLGIFKVKNRDLWPIHDAVKLLVTHFKHVTFTHVPRELNRAADKMVNQTLDEQRSQHP